MIVDDKLRRKIIFRNIAGLSAFCVLIYFTKISVYYFFYGKTFYLPVAVVILCIWIGGLFRILKDSKTEL